MTYENHTSDIEPTAVNADKKSITVVAMYKYGIAINNISKNSVL
jgi:hypothetical protein